MTLGIVLMGPLGLVAGLAVALGTCVVGQYTGLFDTDVQHSARVQEKLNQEGSAELQVAPPPYAPNAPSVTPVTQVFSMESFLKLRAELITQLKLFYKAIPRNSQNNLMLEQRTEALENAWIYIGMTDPKVCHQILSGGKTSHEFIVPGQNILSNGLYKIIFDSNNIDENTLKIEDMSGRGIASEQWNRVLQSAYDDITARNQPLANTAPSRSLRQK